MSKHISTKNRKHVIERANRLCEYCLAPADFAFHPFCVDHVIPISKGGSNDISNLAFSCQNCNAYKYTKTEGTDPITQLKISLFNPRVDKWKEHFVWSDDGTIIIGISSKGRATINTMKMNSTPVINIRWALVLIGVHPPS